MKKRWLLYLAVVVCAVVFFWAYQQWMAWLILVAILCLPVAGLVLSLPAMAGMKLTVDGPGEIPMEGEDWLVLQTKCPWPTPPIRGKISVRRVTTGETWKLKDGSALPSQHCGMLLCRPEKAKVYDYLGLFFLRIRQIQALPVIVRPDPIAVNCLPELERYLSNAWRPKPGGGFAENHELRLYRPGDSLNQVHWKLSSKTGKYIIREAMVPRSNKLLLTMVLRGTPEELDRKFGRLLWLSRELLQRELSHELWVLTGSGLLTLPVAAEEELETAMGTLLSQKPAPKDACFPEAGAAWQYRIGGGENEA